MTVCVVPQPEGKEVAVQLRSQMGTADVRSPDGGVLEDGLDTLHDAMTRAASMMAVAVVATMVQEGHQIDVYLRGRYVGKIVYERMVFVKGRNEPIIRWTPAPGMIGPESLPRRLRR